MWFSSAVLLPGIVLFCSGGARGFCPSCGVALLVCVSLCAVVLCGFQLLFYRIDHTISFNYMH